MTCNIYYYLTGYGTGCRPVHRQFCLTSSAEFQLYLRREKVR